MQFLSLSFPTGEWKHIKAAQQLSVLRKGGLSSDQPPCSKVPNSSHTMNILIVVLIGLGSGTTESLSLQDIIKDLCSISGRSLFRSRCLIWYKPPIRQPGRESRVLHMKVIKGQRIDQVARGDLPLPSGTGSHNCLCRAWALSPFDQLEECSVGWPRWCEVVPNIPSTWKDHRPGTGNVSK